MGLKEDGIERGGSGEIEGEDNKGNIGYLVKEYWKREKMEEVRLFVVCGREDGGLKIQAS